MLSPHYGQDIIQSPLKEAHAFFREINIRKVNTDQASFEGIFKVLLLYIDQTIPWVGLHGEKRTSIV